LGYKFCIALHWQSTRKETFDYDTGFFSSIKITFLLFTDAGVRDNDSAAVSSGPRPETEV